jgi:aldehyde:ferredoxin oxidoreductase
MNGYLGKLLYVNLTSGETWDEALDPTMARTYVGGSGLAARLIYPQVDGDTDPLGPDNPLVLMTGPLVGTAMPSAGRCAVCGLSPLTGIWGESNTGGFIGPEMRFSGYDGIVISGQADRPVWLSIVDGVPQIRDASELWGLDAYATQDRAREALGETRARVACIGPAGENQVPMAAVMNDHGRAAGRTGMGALMGAKRLKALALRGTGSVPLADPEGFSDVVREIVRDLDEDLVATALRMAGTAGYVDMGLMYGDMPIRYFQQGEWEDASNLSGVLMAEQYQTGIAACYRCPIACGRETQALRFGAEKVDGPEYETVAAFGSLAMVDDLEGVIYAGHLCNVYGLDTISTGCTIALACEMFERGALTAEDTGGIRIEYGDIETIHRLIKMMAHREGFGDILAEGSEALVARFDVPDLAATVNGLEVPMHDPRAFSGMAVTYALSPRGACHMQGDMYGVDTGQGPAIDVGIVPGDRFEDSERKGRIAARQHLWRTGYNAWTLCQFQNPGAERVLRALNAATGWGLDLDEVMRSAKRIVALKRMLNLRRGLERGDDRLPHVLLKSLGEGGAEGRVPNLETLLAGAYAELGWDPETGVPTREMLSALDLTVRIPDDLI